MAAVLTAPLTTEELTPALEAPKAAGPEAAILRGRYEAECTFNRHTNHIQCPGLLTLMLACRSTRLQCFSNVEDTTSHVKDPGQRQTWSTALPCRGAHTG